MDESTSHAARKRYEVRYKVRGTNTDRRLGWTNEENGGELMETLKELPKKLDPYIVDRGELPDSGSAV